MEVWKTAIYNGEVYDNYEVSNMGNVRNIKRGKMKKLIKDKYGYLRVGLNKNGKKNSCLVHRLVACTFIPNDNPTVKTQVNHINEFEKENNSVENLEWCTQQYNRNYGTRNERARKSCCKKVMGKSLTENKVIILHSAKQGEKFGFNENYISKCCRGKARQHKGYTWSYID